MQESFFALSKQTGITYRSFLVLDGDLPETEFFTSYDPSIRDIPLIAADGAANRLFEAGIVPFATVGDLDGLKPDIASKINTVYRPNQDSCDFQKSLVYIKDNLLAPSIITGIGGGVLDHILQNINLFLDTDSIFYSPPLFGSILSTNSERKYKLPLNTKISVIGFNAVISSLGLKWEFKNYESSFPGNNSCFNRTQEEDITIKVTKGSALVMIYLQNIQDCGLISLGQF